MRISITIDEDIMYLVRDILAGKPFLTKNKRLVYRLSYQMRPLREKKLLTIARDVPERSSIVYMNGKPKKVEEKPKVFGGYAFDIVFPPKRTPKTG